MSSDRCARSVNGRERRLASASASPKVRTSPSSWKRPTDGSSARRGLPVPARFKGKLVGNFLCRLGYVLGDEFGLKARQSWFTSPRLRGEVGSRSNPGERNSPPSQVYRVRNGSPSPRRSQRELCSSRPRKRGEGVRFRQVIVEPDLTAPSAPRSP